MFIPAPAWRERRGVWLLLILVAVGGTVALALLLIHSLPVSSPFATTTTTTSASTDGVIVGQAIPYCVDVPITWHDNISLVRGGTTVATHTVTLVHPQYEFRVPPGNYELVDGNDPHHTLKFRLNARRTHVATFVSQAAASCG